jgi:NTE family protein
MSIPIFFKAFMVSQGYDMNALFVDGGVLWNLPIQLFDGDSGPNPQTIGICLYDFQNKFVACKVGYGDFMQYAKSLIETLIDGQSDLLYDTKENDFRLIKIDDMGISATDFGITDEQKIDLYNNGILATENFFNNTK